MTDPLRHAPDVVWQSPDASLWGWGSTKLLRPGSGPDRFRRAAAALDDAAGGHDAAYPLGPGSGPVAFCSFGFADGSPGSVVVIPEIVVGRRGDDWWLTAPSGMLPPPVSGEPPPPDRARFAGSSVPDVLWLEAVAAAVGKIATGEIEKVVLARDYALWSRTPFYPPRLLTHLGSRFPSCHIFSIAGLVGASPETLVRSVGPAFASVVLAGTAPSFSDARLDREAGASLLASDKERREHALAVASAQAALDPFTDSLTVSLQPRLLRLDNVQHLASDITGIGRADIHIADLVAALHPTAAVGGTPRGAAVEAIAELEGMDRGRYAGPVGWMDLNGDGEFAIALRCAELSGARARLFAGAGIVRGSLPEAELEETRLKLAAMMGALDADVPT